MCLNVSWRVGCQFRLRPSGSYSVRNGPCRNLFPSTRCGPTLTRKGIQMLDIIFSAHGSARELTEAERHEIDLLPELEKRATLDLLTAAVANDHAKAAADKARTALHQAVRAADAARAAITSTVTFQDIWRTDVARIPGATVPVVDRSAVDTAECVVAECRDANATAIVTARTARSALATALAEYNHVGGRPLTQEQRERRAYADHLASQQAHKQAIAGGREAGPVEVSSVGPSIVDRTAAQQVTGSKHPRHPNDSGGGFRHAGRVGRLPSAR
jgi:hypothetical protein